jgi:L-alanine-DL-glutamate epimerase-like enolase superfamily enzyme
VLPETPGLGMDLDESKIEEQRTLSWTPTRWS